MTVAIGTRDSVIVAKIDGGPQVGIAGYGEDAPEALRDLAAAIQSAAQLAPRLIRIK